MSHSLDHILRDWQQEQTKKITMAPTRQCLVCECLEYPGVEIIDLGHTWLCDNCKTILQKIVKEKEDDS